MRSLSLAALLVVDAAAGACSPAGAFACEGDQACSAGVCQPVGFCSFPDDACASGQRYGAHAGDGLAGLCVGEEPGSSSAATGDDGIVDGDDDGVFPTTTAPPPGADSTSSGGATVDGSGTTDEGCPDWWDCTWPTRVPIVAQWSGSAIDGFPVRVALGPKRFDFTASSPNGADLRFVDESGVVLPHEIEQWNPRDGVAEVWVRLPKLERGARMWLYAGRPDAADAQNPAAVWAPDFIAVWHLQPSLTESTGSAPLEDDGSADGQGRIGRARAFDGTSAYLRPDPALDLLGIFAGGASISAWIHPDAFGQGNFGRIIDFASINTTADGWSFAVGGTAQGGVNENLRFGFGYAPDYGAWRSATGTVVLGQWQHVAVSYEAGDVAAVPALYVDGDAGEITAINVPSGAPSLTTTASAAIGALGSADLRFFAGRIDELRISAGVRSPEWIAAEHADGLDLLLTYEAPESAPR